jgi:hypothetical protein
MGALLLLVLLVDQPPDPRPVVASHRACKYDQRTEACVEALALYSAYLARAPGDSKMHYFFAELLWDQHRFAEAAQHYRQAAADQSAPFSESAAYAAVLARREAMGPRVEPVHDGKPWPLTTEQQALVDAADFYVSHHPRGAHLGAVALAAAYRYLFADDFDAAERRAKWLLERNLEVEGVKGLLEEIATRRLEPPDPRPVPSVGTPATIGAPQTIGVCDENEEDCSVTFEES